MDNDLFLQAIGSLMYAMVATRPDIAFVVGKLYQCSNKPAKRHWLAVQRVFRYLNGTRDYALVYGAGTPILTGYANADYASNPDTRKSTSRAVFTFSGATVYWSSKRQCSVATSTTEAEYITLGQASKTAK